MKYRTLGKTGFTVSEISLGTWQVGGRWGEPFNDGNAEEILHAAVDAGVNFIDTADVYSDGLSEAAVGKVIKQRKERVYVATKCGRKIYPHTNEGYTPDVLQSYVEDSLRNMKLDCIDLIQLHCPPTEVYYRPEIFERFDKLKSEGKIRNLGVSVEKVEEALKAIEYPNVTTVQIIFNMFRQRPAELFFSQAKKKNVGIIVRVPLASGLLSGKFTGKTTFAEGDHRNFNRNGEAFDKGETFSGVDYEKGLEAVKKLECIFPPGTALVENALRWVLMFEEVNCVIPGASKKEQVVSNVKASDAAALTESEMKKVKELYDSMIRYPVHYLW
ncbi:MAG: aldo/keto reductase [Spirochaetales bacterium]|nr:aldo/keto reductase [Spirochaetales bacterium]